MFADILLVVDAHPNTLTVPTQAILKDDKGIFVFVVDKNIAHRTPIQAGGEQNSRTEIVSGLNGYENIITVGQQLVRDGNPVIF
jgi:multidrug efflux pump subunit AcrA (membrane-fusion protein)